MSRRCTAAPGGSAQLQRGKWARPCVPRKASLTAPSCQTWPGPGCPQASPPPAATARGRQGSGHGSGHWPQRLRAAPGAAAISQGHREPGVLRTCLGPSRGRCSLFPPRRATARRAARTSLPTVCLQPAFCTNTFFASLARSHPRHPAGTPRLQHPSPCPGSTTCPCTLGLFSGLHPSYTRTPWFAGSKAKVSGLPREKARPKCSRDCPWLRSR